MVEALTKARDGGIPIVRPKSIEAQIAAVLGLSTAVLRERLAVTDCTSADYVRSETLVHLVRHGRRTNNQTLISLVLPMLLNRCETNLLVKVPDGQLPEAASLREEILGAFSELFASDGAGDAPNELDFYECKFNRAFRFFRIDMVRSETVRIKPISQMPEPDQDDDLEAYEEVFARVSETFRVPSTQENDIFRSELLDAIEGLPPDERDAVILVHFVGYKEESDDPNEETAATRCNCTGRTIRNRLTRAAAKLVRFKEVL